MSLAKALGYKEEDRLLIINADDYGLCSSVNRSVQHLLEAGAISSATVMMPCGWAPAAVRWSAANPQHDIGVHFTFTSEWDAYKWGPVTVDGDVSSLTGPDGYFPKTCRTVEEQAESVQVKTELRSQLRRALQLGLDPSHADNHMGSVYGLETGRHFLVEVLDLCAEFGLPFRVPRNVSLAKNQIAPPGMEEKAAQIAALADAKGVVIPDYVVGLPFALGDGETEASFHADMKSLLHHLPSGVTELIIHPSLPGSELDDFHGEPAKRAMEHGLFLDADIVRTIAEQQIKLIRWSELRRLQRERTGFGGWPKEL